MTIALASDHAGYLYKEAIRIHLEAKGHEVTDFGAHSEESSNYPQFVHPAAAAVAAGQCERGIVLGGSGNGEAMCANRHRGVRCALAWNEESARLGRKHNDANMLSLGQRMMSLADALDLVDAFLEEQFEDGRHRRRIEMIDEF